MDQCVSVWVYMNYFSVGLYNCLYNMDSHDLMGGTVDVTIKKRGSLIGGISPVSLGKSCFFSTPMYQLFFENEHP